MRIIKKEKKKKLARNESEMCFLKPFRNICVIKAKKKRREQKCMYL